MFGFALPVLGTVAKALWTKAWPFVVGALVAALLLALGYTWGHSKAAKEGLKALHAQEKASLERWGEALELIRKIENGLTELEKRYEASTAAILAEWNRERQEDRAFNERRYAELRSGALRLRVPVNPSSVACPATPASAESAASGADGPATAELDGEVAARVLAITDDGDAAIKQLIALQKYTNQLYETCQAKVSP